MAQSTPDTAGINGPRRRRLRVVFAADVANVCGLVSINETKTLDALLNTRRIATEELAASGGSLFGMPGDGLFALFESAVDAVRCALRTQSRLTVMPGSEALRLRIAVHVGDVLFRDNLPFGETLVIAARLESLAEPGGVLISSTVKEAVEARISATFSDYRIREFKHLQRRIGTFTVSALSEPDPDATTMVIVGHARTNLRERSAEENSGVDPGVSMAIAGKVAALPKITPFVLPAAGLGPLDSKSSLRGSTPDANATMGLAASSLAQLTQALTTHVGPVAKVLVKRHAAANVDATSLIAALGEEIPAEAERREFMARARQVIGGQTS